MKLKCIVLVLSFLLIQSLTGQELLWEDTTSSGSSQDVVLDTEGNVYVTGHTGSGTNTYIRTVKCNAATGIKEWSNTWTQRPSVGKAICLDSCGAVYIAGFVKVDTNTMLVVIKYNGMTGDTVWRYQSAIHNPRYRDYWIAVDTSGVYVASDSANSFWLVKLNVNNGNQIWSDCIDKGYSEVWRGIALHANGDIYVAGTQEISGDQNVWTAKYSPNGDTACWLRSYDAGSSEGCDGVDIDNEGNVYVCGTGYSETIQHPIILKYNSDGVKQWIYHHPSPASNPCTDIWVHRSTGTSYITGCLWRGSERNMDVFVCAVDSAGDSLWTTEYGGYYYDIGYELTVTENCVYVGGHYCSTAYSPDILTLCCLRQDGALLWAETRDHGIGDDCNNIAVQTIGEGDAHIATGGNNSGWVTVKYYYCEKIATDDSTALAYNGNRHLARTPNSEELHLVHTRGGEVVYRYSSNGGIDWALPVSVGNGKYPAIALDCDDLPSVTWTDDEGGLWYRRQYQTGDTVEWSDTYHLWNPGPLGIKVNSPPSIAIDPWPRPNKGHILVTRSAHTPTRSVDHNVEDYTFFITQPALGLFVLIEQTQGPGPYPPLRSFPSIARCEVDNSFHAVWQRVDTICYATKSSSQPWNNWGWQFDSSGLQSTHAFVETYGDSIYVVWQNQAVDDIYRGYRHSPDSSFQWQNLSLTLMSSTYPVNASGFFTAYAEEPTASSSYEVYYKVRPIDNRRNLSNTAYNSLYPQCAAKFSAGFHYLYTAWQDGDEAPYEICFRVVSHENEEKQDIAYLSSPNGHNPPSPYLVARDSFISDWQIPVDIGNVRTTYRFPLIPGYAYKAKAIVYHEGSGPWSGRITVDNSLQFLVTYSANVPETLECWIPPALYEDSLLTVSFNRISGDFATVGPIYIYRYEYEGGGGGPMSQQSQPMHDTSLNVFPNPFTENLNITYQIVGQNRADLKLYDVAGRLVKQFDLPSNASSNHIIWDGVDDHGRTVPQGVYFLRIDNFDSGGIICQKVLRIK
jgi:hypothetical protein